MLNDLFKAPDPEPRKVITDWQDDVIMVKVGNYTLGIEATLAIVTAVRDALEFMSETEIGVLTREELIGDLTRIALSMEGESE